METPDARTGSLTPSQWRAVKARGNVLVMAGAGTGKTKTLVERGLDCLERDGANINELLIVTFTEAAAAEMRQRLRRAMETKAAAATTGNFWLEQLALFDLAPIGTLHSFCLKLVREHFYELGLDPQFTLLDAGEARQRANEILDEQFTAHYEGKKDFSAAVQELIQLHGGGRDEAIRDLILRLHHYSQARPDAAAWLAAQLQTFSSSAPADWPRWLEETIQGWHTEWLPALETLKGENEKAAELAGVLSRLHRHFSRAIAAEILGQIVAADLTANYPKGQAGKLRPALGHIFEEARFLLSLATIKDGQDPLAEDWTWVRDPMATLLRLAQEFADRFADQKRRDGVVDFHDLEQFALKLLWDFSTKKPTAVAEAWRAKLKFVFVDEYQDINAAQDQIIAALARDAAGANRFLVGDVKQSIYRFRLADPQIFRDYARGWQAGEGQIIPLSENFRSREGLLDFVNSVCGLVLRVEIGGVAYDDEAKLQFGSPETRGDLGRTKDAAPRVELLLRRKPGRNELPNDADGELADLDEAQKEARLVAWRLKQWIAERHEILDDHAKTSRPAEWRDVAILLRSPRGKSEIYAKEFERAAIPLAVARGGFYQSAEILDLLNLLQLLDNPLQDVPCIAVLRSPLVGLSLDELAEIRLAAKKENFWTAFARSAECGMRSAEASAKVSKFLERFGRWRKRAKQISLSQCLEEILAETFYADWLRAQPRGPQRTANVAALLHLAQKFDQFQRQGLFRFLKFIAAQQAAEVEPEVAAAPAENAVRLMSIHQSKGLEFPVVVLADLAKHFNEQDLRGEIIFDEALGLCPKVKPPGSGRRYPSLPHWLAQRRQKRELRGEELRLLYVALTRARDNLILTASLTGKNWDEKWAEPQPVTVQKIADAKSFADWLALWFSNQVPNSKIQGLDAGELAGLRWHMVPDETLATGWAEPPREPSSPAAEGAPLPQPLDEVTLEPLRARLEWNYPATAATGWKAKSSVTALRREAEALDDEAERLFPAPGFRPVTQTLKAEISNPKLSAAAVGAAHHKFLQHAALEKTGDLAAEAGRLVRENYLSAEERAALDLGALAAFWDSELGEKIRAHPADVRRELPFTARFSPAEIARIIGGQTGAALQDEFVVVQGVVDLAVVLPAEIWLVDFKTDAVGEKDLPEKLKTYAPQLKLYAAALEKIFARKVTRRALHFLAVGRTQEI